MLFKRKSFKSCTSTQSFT